MGMARTFQNIRLFSELSVIDNVKIAYNMHVTYNLADAIVRDGKYLSEEEFITQKALDLLKIFHLEEEAHEVAKTCLMASNVVWKLRVLWLPSRSCCCWTNLLQA